MTRLAHPIMQMLCVYCIVLYCIVLYCIVLYCIVLYCIVLYCIVLCCIVLHCISFEAVQAQGGKPYHRETVAAVMKNRIDAVESKGTGTMQHTAHQELVCTCQPASLISCQASCVNHSMPCQSCNETKPLVLSHKTPKHILTRGRGLEDRQHEVDALHSLVQKHVVCC